MGEQMREKGCEMSANQPPIDPTVLKDLENRFTYHAPKDGQANKYADLREMAHIFSKAIVATTPKSREQSLALTHLEEVVFWANAAIARNE